MGFVHLHVHSCYSFLDGASSLDRLIEKAVALKMPALAITDHNRMTGVIKFYEKAKARGIKPVLGAEIDMEGGYHLTLLCKNMQGYSNLCRLLTEAHLSSRQGQFRVLRDLLCKYSGSLIALSGCRRGEVTSSIAKGDIDGARTAARAYRDV